MIRTLLIGLLGATLGAQEARYFAKDLVESPIKHQLAETPSETGTPAAVRWHDSVDAAVAAAKTSGRPLLRFQLLGKLNERFC